MIKKRCVWAGGGVAGALSNDTKFGERMDNGKGNGWREGRERERERAK